MKRPWLTSQVVTLIKNQKMQMMTIVRMYWSLSLNYQIKSLLLKPFKLLKNQSPLLSKINRIQLNLILQFLSPINPLILSIFRYLKNKIRQSAILISCLEAQMK